MFVYIHTIHTHVFMYIPVTSTYVSIFVVNGLSLFIRLRVLPAKMCVNC